MLSLSDIEAETTDLVSDGLEEKVYPDIVPGRVAHIDADFLAYMASYEKEGEVNDLQDILHRAEVMIADKRRECGAKRAVLHLTPNTSDKGGRYDVAIQRAYQGQRSSDDKPQYLEAVRSWMADLQGDVTGKAWTNAEADDGMANAAWHHYACQSSDLCVVASKDKDLRMVPGLHLDWDTGMIVGAKGTFGFIEMSERIKTNAAGKTVTVKKAVGYGTKFFWLQMLMGDMADNIKGCPTVPADVKNKYLPTAKYTNANDAARAKMDADPKRVACGQVLAYAILDGCNTDRECMSRVMDCYRDLSVPHWETGEPAHWVDIFWAEARMLWMQRTPGDIDDVKKWIKEACCND